MRKASRCALTGVVVVSIGLCGCTRKSQRSAVAHSPVVGAGAGEGLSLRAPSEAWKKKLERINLAEQTTAQPIESLFFERASTVCGPDERKAVESATDKEWAATCRLEILTSDGQPAVGTGWLVAPKLVITAGHCIHGGKNGRFFRSVTVAPAVNGRSEPYGRQVSTEFDVAEGWKDGREDDDYGAVYLRKAFSGDIAPYATQVLTTQQLSAGVARVGGYPYDKPVATMWWHENAIAEASDRQLFYLVDTEGGQSGAAVMLKGKVVGIHTEGLCPNIGVRITSEVEKQIEKWVNKSR